jgi:hypothetical protein
MRSGVIYTDKVYGCRSRRNQCKDRYGLVRWSLDGSRQKILFKMTAIHIPQAYWAIGWSIHLYTFNGTKRVFIPNVEKVEIDGTKELYSIGEGGTIAAV